MASPFSTWQAQSLSLLGCVTRMRAQQWLAAATFVCLLSAALPLAGGVSAVQPDESCVNPALQLPGDSWSSVVGDCAGLHHTVETGAQCLTECAAGASPLMGNVGEGVCQNGGMALAPLACRSSENATMSAGCFDKLTRFPESTTRQANSQADAKHSCVSPRSM